MAAKKRPNVKNQTGMLKKLKKEVSSLKRKEKAAQLKLELAVKKAKSMAKAFALKLERKSKDTKTRMAAAETAIYNKLATSMKKRAKKKRL